MSTDYVILEPEALFARADALRLRGIDIAQGAGLHKTAVSNMRLGKLATEPRIQTLRNILRYVEAVERELLAHLVALHPADAALLLGDAADPKTGSHFSGGIGPSSGTGEPVAVGHQSGEAGKADRPSGGQPAPAQAAAQPPAVSDTKSSSLAGGADSAGNTSPAPGTSRVDGAGGFSHTTERVA